MKCYEGTEPYIFLSYAHKNEEMVMPIFQGLYGQGFRIWYDAGTEPGTEWPEYIAEHLQQANCCICFLTQSFLDSYNCRQELNFALTENIPVLAIYMEECRLTAGMKMRLGLTQAMFRDRATTEAEFFRALYDAKLLSVCRGEKLISSGIDKKQPHDLADVLPKLKNGFLQNEKPSQQKKLSAHAELPDLTADYTEITVSIPEPEEPIPEEEDPCEWIDVPDSEGLEFKKLDDGTYAVVGMGTCQDTELVIPPTTPDGGRVTAIGRFAFYQCLNLKAVDIPTGVTSIGNYAFSGCTGLSSITIPKGVTSIGDYAFAGCTGLSSITIPNHVTSIGTRAFAGCTGLPSITIPKSVKNMGLFVFRDCSSLTVYCEHPAQPFNWAKYWKPSNRHVVWNYKPVHNNEGQPDEGTYAVTDMEVCEEPECRSIESVSAEYADTLMTDREAEAFLIESDEKGGIGKMGIISVGVISIFYQPGETVDLASLQKRGIIDGNIGRIKVLASGVLDKPLVIKADAFSVQAIKMIVCAGGQPILLNSGE